MDDDNSTTIEDIHISNVKSHGIIEYSEDDDED